MPCFPKARPVSVNPPVCRDWVASQEAAFRRSFCLPPKSAFQSTLRRTPDSIRRLVEPRGKGEEVTGAGEPSTVTAPIGRFGYSSNGGRESLRQCPVDARPSHVQRLAITAGDACTLLHRCLQTLCDPCRMPAVDPGLDGPGGPAAISLGKKAMARRRNAAMAASSASRHGRPELRGRGRPCRPRR